MKITSPAFKEGEEIPLIYTCEGKQMSPPLTFHEIPPGTKMLALIMEDPDVPKKFRADGMWDHWVVWNIPPTVRALKEGESPPGVVGINTRGTTNYIGPCPPDARHRYYFKLYALNTPLNLPAGSTKQELINAMHGHIIANAELMGTYEKKNLG